MSEEVQPRDESGQFTPSMDGKYGQEYENAKAGFTTKKDDSPPEETHSDTMDGLRQAAADLKERRSADAPIEISATEYRDIVAKPDLSEALTAKQAARELSAMRGVVTTFAEGVNLNNLAAEVDLKRAEILKANPKAAEELGLSDDDIAAAKKADSEVAEPKQTRVRPDPIDGSSVEGLDPEVEKALKHPQVRQALQEEFGRAEQSQQQYAAAVNQANQFAQQSLIDALPELGQIGVEHWEAAIHLLAQSDPARVQRALGVIERVSQLSAAQVEIAQHRAIQQRQQFIASTEAEDASLVKMIGEDAANAANTATLDFLINNGIERRHVVDFVHRHPLVATAQARQLIWKAAQFDKIKSTSKSMAPLPPVQRPGLSTGRSPASDGKGKIAALQAQLESATGSKAAKIAAQIRTLKRSA